MAEERHFAYRVSHGAALFLGATLFNWCCLFGHLGEAKSWGPRETVSPSLCTSTRVPVWAERASWAFSKVKRPSGKGALTLGRRAETGEMSCSP